MTTYVTIEDLTKLGKSLTAAQSEVAKNLIEIASAKLRTIALKYGKNIDEMIADEDTGEDFAIVVKSVVSQAVLRAMTSIEDTVPAATQVTQSGLGYSASMTYLNAGQSLYFLRNELKELGILRQTYGGLGVYGDA